MAYDRLFPLASIYFMLALACGLSSLTRVVANYDDATYGLVSVKSLNKSGESSGGGVYSNASST